jgi:xanthine dehydrogenase FAD-binding subunit
MKELFFLPKTLEELWQILSDIPDAMIYAGGTDLLVRLKNSHLHEIPLVCIERIDQLKIIEERGDNIFVGSGVTHAELMKNSLICKNFPVLVNALKVLGSPQIRNMGTIGGNIITASPAGDTLPPLYVLEAQLELCTRTGKRLLPIEQFITGPGKTQLINGEILTGILVPKAHGFNIHHFEKVGKRKALSISIVSFCALVKLSSDGIVEYARFAWGSVGPTVIRCHEAEDLLIGNKLSTEILKKASESVRRVVRPIDDIRASAWYRREVACNLLTRLINYKV